MLDSIIRYENYDRDIRKFFKIFDIPYKKLTKGDNKSHYMGDYDYREYYTDDIRECVYSLCSNDRINFVYTFDSIKPFYDLKKIKNYKKNKDVLIIGGGTSVNKIGIPKGLENIEKIGISKCKLPVNFYIYQDKKIKRYGMEVIIDLYDCNQ